MKMQKSFDCVEMKNTIQAQPQQQWEALTESQIRTEIQEHQATSDDEVAKWWRSVRATKQRP